MQICDSNVDTFPSLWKLIGNTPMIRISYKYAGEIFVLFVKCEYFNLTGSIKDRMVLYVFQQAYLNGELVPGNTIVEATSGNTGISLAAIGKSLGHKVHIIMPDWLSVERISIIKSFGAKISLVSKEDGGFLGSIERAEEIGDKDPNVFLPRQFENACNVEAHKHTTGREISEQLWIGGLAPDAFVGGVGTGGTIMGVAAHLRESNPRILIKAIEPTESPTLSTGHKVGFHRIQGISDEFIPKIVDLNSLDGIIKVHDGDAILMAQKVAHELGLGIGISSGANIIGAMLTQQVLGNSKAVVTVFPDSNKKYLSTDLMKVEPVKRGYITPLTEFLGYSTC